MECRGSILVLIGLPASGKTTIAKCLESSSTGFALVYRVSYDELVPLSSQARIVQSQEEKLWKSVRTAILDTVRSSVLAVFDPSEEMAKKEASVSQDLAKKLTCLSHQLQQFLSRAKTDKKDFCIIIDDNMYYSSMRYDYFKIARTVGWGYCQLYLHCSVDEAKWNNGRREQPVPECVYDMALCLELPKPLERSWEHYSVILMCNKGIFLPLVEDCATFLNVLKQALVPQQQLAELSLREKGAGGSESYAECRFDAQEAKVKKEMLDGIKWLISMALTHPFKHNVNKLEKLEEVIAARNACERSVLHQLDKILRKVVSYQIKSIPNNYCREDMQKLSEIYASCRKNILAKLRDGSLHVPQHFSFAIRDKRMTSHVVQEIENYLTNLFYANVQGKVALYNYI